MSVIRRRDQGMDWPTFSIYLALLAIGWLMVYTVGYGDGYPEGVFNLLSETIVGRQTIWIGVSMLIFFSTQIVDWKFWRTFAYPIYGISIILLIAVLLFGNTIKGATSWFVLGGFSFQPSELAKFGTALGLAAFLNNFNTNLRKNILDQLMSFALLAAPILLILLQPDAGSALVFLSFLILLYREGLSVNYYVIGGFIVAMFLFGFVHTPSTMLIALLLFSIFILLLNIEKRKLAILSFYVLLVVGTVWILLFTDNFYYVLGGIIALLLGVASYLWLNKKERVVVVVFGGLLLGLGISSLSNYAFNNFLLSHQQDRINVWLNPSKCDPRGSLYNVLQSKMAIGSGGLEGKGFLKGNMTKLDFVPEQTTDFIFCTVGEEQGFIGAFSIIVLFLLLLYRITVIAERQRSNFSRHYAYGVAGVIFIHVFINIGMTIGLMPIIGIPLPFISYGGSSLLGFTLLLGVLLKLDAHRTEA